MLKNMLSYIGHKVTSEMHKAAATEAAEMHMLLTVKVTVYVLKGRGFTVGIGIFPYLTVFFKTVKITVNCCLTDRSAVIFQHFSNFIAAELAVFVIFKQLKNTSFLLCVIC